MSLKWTHHPRKVHYCATISRNIIMPLYSVEFLKYCIGRTIARSMITAGITQSKWERIRTLRQIKGEIYGCNNEEELKEIEKLLLKMIPERIWKSTENLYTKECINIEKQRGG